MNDAPVITNLSGDALSYNEGDGAVVLEQGGNATVADVDSADFNTGTLTVSFTAGSDSAEDVLAIRNQGTGAGQIGVSGANVTYQGVTIGTFTGGSSGTNLVVTLNSQCDPDRRDGLGPEHHLSGHRYQCADHGGAHRALCLDRRRRRHERQL